MAQRLAVVIERGRRIAGQRGATRGDDQRPRRVRRRGARVAQRVDGAGLVAAVGGLQRQARTPPAPITPEPSSGTPSDIAFAQPPRDGL